MANIQLFINGVEVDITSSDRLPLSVSRKVDEVKDITKRGGDKTATFSLPYSPNNVRFFGDLAAPSGVSKFNRAISYVCDIYADSIMIFRSAFLKLNEVSVEDGFKCFIVASNVNFSNEFKERRLRNLELRTIPFKGGLDVVAINALVDTSNPSFYAHPELYDCVFPLVAYNRFFIPNRWERGNFISQKKYLPNTAGFDANGIIDPLPDDQKILDQTLWALGVNSLDGNANLAFNSYPPACYLVSVIKKMFADLGFIATGRWVEDPEVRKMVIPFTATDGQIAGWNWASLETAKVTSDATVKDTYLYGERRSILFQNIVETLMTFSLANNTSITPRVIDTDTSRSLTYRPPALGIDDLSYVAKTNGRYSVRMKLTGESASVIPYYNIYFLIVKNPTPEPDGRYFDLFESAAAPDIFFKEKVTVVGSLPAGTTTFSFDETIEIDLLNFNTISPLIAIVDLTGASAGTIIIGNVTEMLFEVNNISADVDLQPARFLPDVDQITFWKAIVSMFNLYVAIDPVTGVAYIDNYPNFYEPNDKALEIECDPRRFAISPIESSRNFLFDYESDEKDFAVTNTGGALQFREIATNPTIYANGSTNIKTSPFVGTAFETYSIVDDTADDFLEPVWEIKTQLTLPSLITNEGDLRPQNDWVNFTPPTGFKPRIIKVKELVTFPAGAFIPLRVWDESQPIGSRDYYYQQNQYVRCAFEDLETPAIDTIEWSLSFNGQRGLFRKNYESQIYLYQYSHIAECEVRLTAPQFWQLSFRKKIRINGDVYYLQELKDYNPAKPTLTKLTLIKVL